MNRRYSLIVWAMNHKSIVFLVTGILVLFGILAIVVMPKQEFPGYTIRQGIIAGVYPGATSEEVEKQLAEPLEQFLFTYPEVKRNYTTTTSRNGICYAMVELNDNVKNKDEVWSKIRHGLTALKAQLPAGVLALVAQDDFGDVSAILIAIESETGNYNELKDYADELGHRLRRIESVSNIRLYGQKDEQVTVYVDRDKLTSYGISDKILLAKVLGQSVATGGKIKNEEVTVPVHFNPAYASVHEIEEQILFSDPAGNMIRVKDLADVKREFPAGNSFITYNGNPCLVLSIEMREGYNIVKFGKDIAGIVSEFRGNYLPAGAAVSYITNQAEVVNGSVLSFLRDLLIAIAVIIIVMMILFPFRSALVAAIVIPLNTFISVGIMYLSGIPLNTVTLAALVVVLGMTVDNSIVIIDGYIYLLKSGFSPRDAAIESAHKYFMPMFLATACICLIFYPLLILFKGQMAEFIWFFPFTFTINMMMSLVLAVLVIPILEAALIKPLKENERDGKRITGKVHDQYVRLLGWNFRHPWTTVAIGAVSVVFAVFLIPHVKFRMNPLAERNQFAVEIYLPDGMPLNRTVSVADSLRMILSADKRVKSITQFNGMSSPRFHIAYAPKMPSDNYAQFIVNTSSPRETEAVLDKYTDSLAHIFPDAYVKFRQIDFQHVPSFEFRFSGNDAGELKNAVAMLSGRMNEMPELTNIHDDWGKQQPVMNVELDPVASSQLGVSRAITAANLMLATDRLTMGVMTENNKNIPIVLTTRGSDHAKLDDLEGIYVAGMIPSVNVPLRQIATVRPEWSEDNIVHRDGIRTITVTADTKRGIIPAKSLSLIRGIIEKDIVPALPGGIRYQVGGEPEYNHDNLMPVVYAIIAAFVVVFFFFLFTYGKFRLTFISLFTLLLFMFGSVFGIWISGLTAGLTTALGIIGLFGLTVRNVILMFQHAEDLFVNKGWTAKDAAFDAGKRRMIPIFLTSAAASVGVIPMIIGGSSFWAPVGVVIFAGGAFLLLMTVTILPVLYWKLNEKKQ